MAVPLGLRVALLGSRVTRHEAYWFRGPVACGLQQAAMGSGARSDSCGDETAVMSGPRASPLQPTHHCQSIQTVFAIMMVAM